MATQRGREVPAVIDQLLAEPRRFDFFQAVRLLERHAQQTEGASGAARQPVGRDSAPQHEVVRFRAYQSLTLPTAEIEEFGRPALATEAGKPALPERPPEMFVNFMGLTGPSGVLPRHYTQLVLEQLRDGAERCRTFLTCSITA